MAQDDVSRQGAQLPHSCRDAVAPSAQLRGEQLGSQQEGGGIGAELPPEGAQIVHGLKPLQIAGAGCQSRVGQAADEEQGEDPEEAEHLQPRSFLVLLTMPLSSV